MPVEALADPRVAEPQPVCLQRFERASIHRVDAARELVRGRAVDLPQLVRAVGVEQPGEERRACVVGGLCRQILVELLA